MALPGSINRLWRGHQNWPQHFHSSNLDHFKNPDHSGAIKDQPSREIALFCAASATHLPALLCAPHVKTKGKSHQRTSTSPVSFSFSTKLSTSVSGPASSRRYRGYSVRGSFWKSTARTAHTPSEIRAQGSSGGQRGKGCSGLRLYHRFCKVSGGFSPF